MSWEWSHAAEAESKAYENLHNTEHDELCVIYAEIQATKANGQEFSNLLYETALRFAHKLTADVLADYIWEWASNYRTCTNGGAYFHVCPYGCHMVSVDSDSER